MGDFYYGLRYSFETPVCKPGQGNCNSYEYNLRIRRNASINRWSDPSLENIMSLQDVFDNGSPQL